MQTGDPQLAFPVFILFHNDADVLEQTISSVLQQDLDHALEITAIDLGSTDGSRGIMKKYQPDKFLTLREGTLPGVALNRAFSECSAPWVLLVRAGAEPSGSAWLRNLLNEKEINSRAALLACRRKWRREALPVSGDSSHRETGSPLTRDWLSEPDAIAAALFRRQAWQEHPFREDLEAYELGEWADRVENSGWQTVIAEKAEVYFGRRLRLREAYRKAYRAAYSLALSDCGVSAGESFCLSTRRVQRVLEESLADAGEFLRAGNIFRWPQVVAGRFLVRLAESRGFRRGLLAKGHGVPASAPGIMANRKPR